MAGTSTFMSGDGPVAELLCDSGAADTPFVRIYKNSSIDDSVTVTDVDLDGVAYVVVGPATQCVEEVDLVDTDDEILVLCDFIVGGPVQFLRRYTIDDGVVTTTDTDLDGTTPYVVTGIVTICDGAQKDYEPLILCDLGAGGVQFARAYRDTVLGVVIADTLLDGTTPYAVVGPVAACTEVTGPGGGPVVVGDGGGSLTVDGTVSVSNQPDDSEPIVLCDSGAADKPFLRKYEYDATGAFVSATDTELDGTTAYVPVGPVVNCAGGGGGSGSGLPTVEACPACDSINQTGVLYSFEDIGATGRIVTINPNDGVVTAVLATAYDDMNCLAYLPDQHALIGRRVGGGDFHLIDLTTLTDTNLGVAAGLPGGTWIFAAWDPKTMRYYVGASGGQIYYIDFSGGAGTLTATLANPTTLATGSGDMCFDGCGRLFTIIDGVIRRRDTVAAPVATTIATVADTGSGWGGGAACQAGIAYLNRGNLDIVAVNLSTGLITNGIGPIASGNTQSDWAIHPDVKSYRGFKRIFDVDAAGSVTGFSDIDEDGDPFTPLGDVSLGECPDCSCFCGSADGANTRGYVTTAIGGGSSYTTTRACRRATIIFEPQPAAPGSRDTINGVVLPDTLIDTTWIFGTLNSPGRMAAVTVESPAASGRTITIVEEL